MSPRASAAGLALAALLAMPMAPAAAAGYDSTPSTSASTLAQALLAQGSGLQIVAGSALRLGTSTQTGTMVSLPAPWAEAAPGIVLSSGSIAGPVEPGHLPDGHLNTGSGAHAAISALIGRPSFDQAVLRFDFRADPGLQAVTGTLVFGAEDFPEWVGSTDFSDALLILVDGVNAATVGGLPFTTASAYAAFGMQAAGQATGWDGMTPLLSFTAALDPGRSVHQIELAIADIGDGIYDSAVFVGGLRGAAVGLPGVTPAVPEPAALALWPLGLAGLVATVRRRQRGCAASARAASATSAGPL